MAETREVRHERGCTLRRARQQQRGLPRKPERAQRLAMEGDGSRKARRGLSRTVEGEEAALPSVAIFHEMCCSTF